MNLVTNVRSVKIVELIEVQSIIGAGTPDDPVRRIYEWYTRDGILVAWRDTNEDGDPGQVFVSE